MGMNDELILHVWIEKSSVVKIVGPVEAGRERQLILVAYPVKWLMIDDTLRLRRNRTAQQENNEYSLFQGVS